MLCKPIALKQFALHTSFFFFMEAVTFLHQGSVSECVAGILLLLLTTSTASSLPLSLIFFLDNILEISCNRISFMKTGRVFPIKVEAPFFFCCLRHIISTKFLPPPSCSSVFLTRNGSLIPVFCLSVHTHTQLHTPSMITCLGTWIEKVAAGLLVQVPSRRSLGGLKKTV